MTATPSLRLTPFKPPISQENAAIVRSVYAAFRGLAQGGEIASYVVAHFASDREYRPGEEASTLRGHNEIIQSDQVVIAAIRVHGRGRKSGIEISQRLFDVFELHDGKILRIREYLDP